MKNYLTHLRIPFSFFLLPSVLIGLQLIGNRLSWSLAFHILILWHIWIYPASQAFNTAYDRDQTSIGGLEFPPEVPIYLGAFSLLWECFGILYALLFLPHLVGPVILYGLASKAYSHPSIRLKRYPALSTIIVVFFQGAYVTLFSALGSRPISIAAEWSTLLLSSSIVLSGYPLTQIYQHREDSDRGDQTLSMLLGVQGTVIFSDLVTLTTGVLLFLHLLRFKNASYAGLSLGVLAVGSFFSFVPIIQALKSRAAISYSLVFRPVALTALLLNVVLVSSLIFSD